MPISASKRDGIEELVERAKIGKSGLKPKKLDFCKGEVHRAIHSIAHIIEEKANSIQMPVRFAATKLVEGDEPMAKELDLSKNESEIIESIIKDMEKALNMDREAALADMRYDYIENLCENTVTKYSETSKEHLRSIQIDNVLTNKIWGIPIFLGIMLLVFWLTFGVFGSYLSDLLVVGIGYITKLTDQLLLELDVSPWLHSLVIDGVFAGVGSVLSFLPIILVLFFFFLFWRTAAIWQGLRL